jgi:hypothetical protein
VESLTGAAAEQVGNGRECVRDSLLDEGDRVWQQDRVRLGVREVECAAEGVAELVVDRHPHASEDGPAQPGAVERTVPAGPVGGVADEGRQRIAQCAEAFDRHQRVDGTAVARVDAFGRVRHRVQAAGHRERQRQRVGQLRVANDDLGQDLGSAAGRLQAVLGLPEDGGHL